MNLTDIEYQKRIKNVLVNIVDMETNATLRNLKTIENQQSENKNVLKNIMNHNESE